MTLRRLLVTLLAAVSFVAARADERWQWPIAGAEAGDSIIYKPQTYIGEELNFYDLFIAAPFDAVVVAPDDCVVTSVGWSYSLSLSSSTGSSIEAGEDFDTRAKDMAEGIGRGVDPKYVNHSIGLRVADGRTIYISGLCIDRAFKTGESIARGDTLGRVRYSYRMVEEPSVMFSVTTRGGKVDDPMTPFGLTTSFIPPQELKPVTELTVEQAHEDIDVMIDAFIDCYPSLDDLISREELEEYRRETKASVTETIPIKKFGEIMERTNALLHDSHVAFWGIPSSGEQRYWDVYIGRVGDDVRIVLAMDGFEEYLNRRVTAVDGIPADSLLRMSAQYIGGYDAAVEEYLKCTQFGTLMWSYIDYRPDTEGRGCEVTFDDGTSLHVEGHIWKGEKLSYSPSRRDYLSVNRTAYHYMTALKFVDICLPNSRVTWHIPLVKCVFDTTENPRIPYGRGVIPDIYVPLTYEEVASTNGDAILNRALEAIANGEYLGENPFGDDAKDGCAVPAWGWWTAAAVVLLLLLTLLRRGKK